MKIYEIYQTGSGFSAKTIDYTGVAYLIAANSIKQAYAIGHKKSWATGPGTTGIVEHYTRGGSDEGWHQLWDGCRIHFGIGLNHGDGVRKITTAMQAHLAEHP